MAGVGVALVAVSLDEGVAMAIGLDIDRYQP
jgi:hypothetical protein